MIYLKTVGLPEESNNLNHSIQNRRGQATIEYILILVVVVGLILSLMNQFFKPMGNFINSYMGNYLSCLLESGELPSLGGPSGLADPEGCNAQFEEGTLAKGRPPKSQSTSQSGGSNNRSKEPGKDREASGAGGGGTGGRYAGSAGRRGGYSSSPGSVGSAERSAADSKVVEISLGSTPEAGFYARRSTSSYGDEGSSRRSDKIVDYELSESEKKAQEDEKKAKSKVISEDSSPRPAKKFEVKPPLRDIAAAEIDDLSWDFGDYFRFLLIAAIIIILIALIGGQIAKLMKSWEK